tara:strand:+ start:397 stop:969 length:573 start_codon:yes stop_codon:yes gene_type:complete
MAKSNILEIIQGLQQAAANAYDGAHDERYSHDGVARKIGISREEGDPILDKRVMDGFGIKFYNDSLCITYQSDIQLKEIYDGDFENEIARKLNEIKKFLQREYKAITGNSITLTKEGDPDILAQSTSRVRSFVNAKQHYKISGVKPDEFSLSKGSENRKVDDAVRKFLEMGRQSAKRPQNVTFKKGANQK